MIVGRQAGAELVPFFDDRYDVGEVLLPIGDSSGRGDQASFALKFKGTATAAVNYGYSLAETAGGIISEG